jgi:hypothetical protein
MRVAPGLLVVLVALAAPATALASDSWTAPSDLFVQRAEVENTTSYGVESFEPTGTHPGCRAVGKTAWWRITGNGQSITLSTALAPTNFDTVLSVYTGAPPSPTFKACNDNLPGDVLNRSQLTFASVRGTSYLVQVGGFDNCAGTAASPCPEFGNLGITATTAVRPTNDDRANAATLLSSATAQADNTGATSERGEDTGCDGVPFAATVWYRWSAPAVGDATFHASAAFTDTVLAVYRADSGVRVGCNDEAAGSTGASQLVLRVSPGDYLLQIGARGADGPTTGQGIVLARTDFAEDRDGDDDGVSLPADCNDANPAIRPGIADVFDDGIDQDCDGADAINLDRDGDGYNRPGDCNDSDRTIHPQATDVPGNKVDEDCTGGPAPYPRLASTVRSFFDFPPLTFTGLTVVRAIQGSRIELRCHGAGCFKRKVIAVKRSRAAMSLLKYVRRARVKTGGVVEVRITKRLHVGVVRRITARGARRPKLQDLCLPVGKTRPVSC